MDERELSRLIDGACDGKLTTEETSQLREHLSESDDALRHFVRRTDLHGQLQWELGVGLPSVVSDLIPDLLMAPKVERPHVPQSDVSVFEPQDSQTAGTGARKDGNRSTPNVFWRGGIVVYGRWIAAVAAMLVAGVLLWDRGRPGVQRSSVATVTASRRCVFRSAGTAFKKGDSVGHQPIDLQRGVLRLQVGSSAVVTAEGPARFSIAGPDQVMLHSGRVVVKMSLGESKSRFTVATPSFEVVDLGTEFGVQYSGPVDFEGRYQNDYPTWDSDSIVQVFDGSVVIRKIRDAGPGESFDAEMSSRLQAGEAVRISDDGIIEPNGFSETRFTREIPPSISPQVPQNLNWNSNQYSIMEVSQFGSPSEIDGVLGEWELADSILLSQQDLSHREYAEMYLKYDATNLYLAAVVGDPFAMRNRFSPADESPYAWTGGGVQLDLKRREEPSGNSTTLFFWHSAQDNQAAVSIRSRVRESRQYLAGPSTKASETIGKFVKSFSDTAYSCEFAIPWSKIGRSPPSPGEVWQGTFTVFWSDSDGRHWRGQMASTGASSQREDLQWNDLSFGP